jgi:hypothetical protein
MAFNFSPGGVYNPRSLDFSALANIPDNFWQGQDRAKLGTAREEVSAALANGDYQAAASALAKLDPTKAYMSANDTGNDRFGMQLVFDDKGNAYQPHSAGGIRPVEVPSGGRLTQPQSWVQTPQGVFPRPKAGVFGGGSSPQGGAELPVYGSQEEADAAAQDDAGLPPQNLTPPAPTNGTGAILKDYATPETQKTGAEIAEKSRKALPAAEEMTRRVISAIEQVEKSPNLSSLLGGVQGRLPTFFDKNSDTEALIEQSIGGVFTTVYESLRGAQAITDVEGAKATSAITRLQKMTQSEPGYRAALSDAKYEVFELTNTLRKKADLSPVPNPYRVPGSGGEGGNKTKSGVQWSIEQ